MRLNSYAKSLIEALKLMSLSLFVVIHRTGRNAFNGHAALNDPGDFDSFFCVQLFGFSTIFRVLRADHVLSTCLPHGICNLYFVKGNFVKKLRVTDFHVTSR